ncbi:hypothetical protein EB061_10145 [bacterium]|nr:hypothetical protein [bacterium]
MAHVPTALAGPWEDYLRTVTLDQVYVKCAYQSKDPADRNAIRLLISPAIAGSRSVSLEFSSTSEKPALRAGRNIQENLAPDLARVSEDGIELDLSSSFQSRPEIASVKSFLAKRTGFGSPFEGAPLHATGDDFSARVQKMSLFGKVILGRNQRALSSMVCRLVAPAEFEDHLMRETLWEESEPRIVTYCEGKQLPAGQTELDRASECMDYRMWKRVREARGESTIPRTRIRYAFPGPRVVEVLR